MEETEKVEFDYEEGYKKVKEENKELKEVLNESAKALCDATFRVVKNELYIAKLKNKKKQRSFVDGAFLGFSIYCIVKVAREWFTKLK